MLISGASNHASPPPPWKSFSQVSLSVSVSQVNYRKSPLSHIHKYLFSLISTICIIYTPAHDHFSGFASSPPPMEVTLKSFSQVSLLIKKDKLSINNAAQRGKRIDTLYILLAQKRLTRTEENIYFVNRPKIGQILSDFNAVFDINSVFYLTFQLLEEDKMKKKIIIIILNYFLIL